MLGPISLPLAAMAMAASDRPTISFTAEQVLIVSDKLLREGREEEALSLYQGLDADPSPRIRVEALARRAAILERRGKGLQAAVLMRRAVDLEPREGVLRMGLARMLDKAGDMEGARRQMRAAQAGNLSPALARLAQRYANSLRSRSPYGWSVELSLAPDSNINRATRSDTLETVIGEFDLDKDAKARSGVGAAMRGSGFVRVALSPSLNWMTRADVSQDRYRDKEFNRSSLGLSSGPELALGRTRISLEAGIGRASFGGKTFQRWAQVSGRAYRPVGRRTAVGTNVSVARIDNLFNDLQDGRSVSGSLSIERAMTANAGLQAQVSASRFAASDPGYSTRAVEIGAGGWLDLGRFTFSASVATGKLEADERLALFPEKRLDRSLRASVGVTTRNIELLGFSPVVRLSWERNRSTVQIWDYGRRRLEVGVQRAF